MKGLETGKDKVKKICEALRKETLEPAQFEAGEIVEIAKAEAEKIVADAKKLVDQMQADAKAEIERQKNVFQASLNQACRQTIELLKQNIEQKLFNPELSHLIAKQTQDPKVLAGLITAVVKALEKDGIDANLSVYVPAAVPAKAVNTLLAQNILDKLKEKSVLLGDIEGGVEVKLHKENITVDISDSALKDLVASYTRKDFRDMFFGTV
jgi:V/A-type H+-transporting ATPase subunit E